MERETLTFVTLKEQHTIVIKSYLTGREKRQIQSVFLRDVSIETVGNDPQVKGIKGNILEQAENTALATLLVSIDGTNENLVERVLDMPSVDYDFVVSEVNKVTNSNAFEFKKKI